MQNYSQQNSYKLLHILSANHRNSGAQFSKLLKTLLEYLKFKVTTNFFLKTQDYLQMFWKANPWTWSAFFLMRIKCDNANVGHWSVTRTSMERREHKALTQVKKYRGHRNIIYSSTALSVSNRQKSSNDGCLVADSVTHSSSACDDAFGSLVFSSEYHFFTCLNIIHNSCNNLPL